MYFNPIFQKKNVEMAMAKIIEKNFWIRDLAHVICKTQMFEEFIKNFPKEIIEEQMVTSVYQKSFTIKSE